MVIIEFSLVMSLIQPFSKKKKKKLILYKIIKMCGHDLFLAFSEHYNIEELPVTILQC